MVFHPVDPSGRHDSHKLFHPVLPEEKPEPKAVPGFFPVSVDSADLHADPDVLLRPADDRDRDDAFSPDSVSVYAFRSYQPGTAPARGERRPAGQHYRAADAASFYLQYPDEYLLSVQTGRGSGAEGDSRFYKLSPEKFFSHRKGRCHSVFRRNGTYQSLSGCGAGPFSGRAEGPVRHSIYSLQDPAADAAAHCRKRGEAWPESGTGSAGD